MRTCKIGVGIALCWIPALFAAFASPVWAHNDGTDQAAIRQLMRKTWERPDALLSVEPVVVVGDYAIAGWIQDDRGGRALLRRQGIAWEVVLCAAAIICKWPRPRGQWACPARSRSSWWCGCSSIEAYGAGASRQALAMGSSEWAARARRRITKHWSRMEPMRPRLLLATGIAALTLASLSTVAYLRHCSDSGSN